MDDESFVNAANYIARGQAGLRDRLTELKAAYIANNSLLKYPSQRVWVGGKLYGLTSIKLSYYRQRVSLTYTLRPYVKDGSRVGGNGASIRLNSSYMEDWVNISVEKP
jgi:hypothetical protein